MTLPKEQEPKGNAGKQIIIKNKKTNRKKKKKKKQRKLSDQMTRWQKVRPGQAQVGSTSAIIIPTLTEHSLD